MYSSLKSRMGLLDVLLPLDLHSSIILISWPKFGVNGFGISIYNPSKYVHEHLDEITVKAGRSTA
jgi:hypothetical protein